MRVIELLRKVSDRLSDQEIDFTFETWTKQQVLDSLNSAIAALARYAPDSFSQIVKIDLNAGDIQDSGCQKIIMILGVYSRAGEFIAPLEPMERMNHAIVKRKQRLACRAPLGYPLAAEIMTDTQIRVYPTMLSASDYKIHAKCLSVPQVEDFDAEVPVPLHIIGAFEEFMLYYLYDIDNESVPNRERSGTHWANAFTLLGVGNDRTPRG